jgi:hypothetical protein
VLDELLPSTWRIMEQYANNPVEADHGRLKVRLTPMRGLNKLRSAYVVSTGHAFVQNVSRGYELRHRCPPEASNPCGLRRTPPRHLIERHSGQPCLLSVTATVPSSSVPTPHDPGSSGAIKDYTNTRSISLTATMPATDQRFIGLKRATDESINNITPAERHTGE